HGMGDAIPEFGRVTETATHLRAAEAFARTKQRVFPLAPGTKIPPKGFTGGVNNATCDLDLVRRWWEPEPEANIGLACGDQPAGFGLLVIDVDVKGGKPGKEEIKRLEATYGRLPRTIRQDTPSGGGHYFYRYQVGLNVRGGTDRLAPGVDVRAIGQYVAVAPSRTSLGAYRFHDRFTVDAIESAPKWLLDLLIKEDRTRTNGHAASPGIEAVRDVLRFIPSRPPYDEWVRVIAAVLDGTEGDADAAET